MTNYDSMSLEELEAENIRLSNERAAIKQQQLELTAAIDRKIAERDAGLKLAAMSPAEKAAIAQIVQVQAANASAEAKKAGE